MYGQTFPQIKVKESFIPQTNISSWIQTETTNLTIT